MKFHLYDTALGICIVSDCERDESAAIVFADSGVDVSAYQPLSFDNEILWAAYMMENYSELLTNAARGAAA